MSHPVQMVKFQLADHFSKAAPSAEFSILDDGAYFSYVLDETQTLHGDAWSLASYLTSIATVAKQEVLYVGLSYGKDGSRNVAQRLNAHSTLQRIYEDHGSDPWDIFVAPISIETFSWTTEDHLDDDEPGPDYSTVLKYFQGERHYLTQSIVDLVEQGLIAYFQPSYNKLLVRSESGNGTRALRHMQEARYRRLILSFMGWQGLARFWSPFAQDAYRAHTLVLTIPSPPRRPALTCREVRAIPGSANEPEGYGDVFPWASRVAVEENEAGPVILKVFGDDAPAVRRPPGVVLPFRPPS